MSTHECFIPPINVKNPRFVAKQWSDQGKQWFFDMETKKVWDEEKGAHFFVPNFIVLKSETGDRHIFEGSQALEQFSRFCFAGENSLAHAHTSSVVGA